MSVEQVKAQTAQQWGLIPNEVYKMLANVLDKIKISLALYSSLPEFFPLQDDLNNVHLQFLWREHIGAGQIQCGCWVQTNTCIKVILVLWWDFFPFPAFAGFQMQTYT